MDKKLLFDLQAVPLVYGSSGVVIDFVKHKTAEIDADLFSAELETVFTEDSPLTILERTITTTGAAQTLIIPGPAVGGSPNLAGEVRVIAIDLAFQLNNFTLPKTDFKFEVRFRNAAGVELASRTQSIEGTASVREGDTRQFIRMLCFEQNSTLANNGTVSSQDGKSVSLPRLRAADSATLATIAGILTVPVTDLAKVWPDLWTDVAQIEIDIPVGAFAPGVGITAVPVTVGRLGTLADIIMSLADVKTIGNAPMVDTGRAGLLSRLAQTFN